MGFDWGVKKMKEKNMQSKELRKKNYGRGERKDEKGAFIDSGRSLGIHGGK